MQGGGASRARRAARELLWLVPLVLFTEQHVVSVASVSGRSMQPTFNPDSSGSTRDIVLLDRQPVNMTLSGGSAATRAWQVGDVVTLRSPLDPGSIITKRIVALPGSLVVPRVRHPSAGPSSVSSSAPPRRGPDLADKGVPTRVPPGHVWLEGDEPVHSRDSNDFGPVPLGLLTSRVVGVIWPLSRQARVDIHARDDYFRHRVFVPADDERGRPAQQNLAHYLKLAHQNDNLAVPEAGHESSSDRGR